MQPLLFPPHSFHHRNFYHPLPRHASFTSWKHDTKSIPDLLRKHVPTTTQSPSCLTTFKRYIYVSQPHKFALFTPFLMYRPLITRVTHTVFSIVSSVSTPFLSLVSGSTNQTVVHYPTYIFFMIIFMSNTQTQTTRVRSATITPTPTTTLQLQYPLLLPIWYFADCCLLC